MKIIGYSERGAMNALFYGLAKQNDTNGLKKILYLAGIKDYDKYDKFTLYAEFSLSQFGDPDLVIIAEKPEKTVFFIEAKASCCKEYNLNDEYKKHDDYFKSDKYKKGQTSNLFFQFKLKQYFFKNEYENIDNQIKFSGNWNNKNKRKLGTNPIVNKFANIIKDCKKAYYIAIIPKQYNNTKNEKFNLEIHFVTWEDISSNESFNKYIANTIDFNQTDNKSQIFNNLIKK